MFEDLELEPHERQLLAQRILDYGEEYLRALPDKPASWPPIDPALVERLGEAPGESGVALEQLFNKLDAALATGIDTSSGKFLSYIPSGGIYTAALGRLLGAIVNRYTGGTHGAPGLIAIEHGVVTWMCGLFGLPATSSGVLLSGGSTANLTATVAARARLGADFSSGVVYTSERAHHSVTKAAVIAGIHPDRIRRVPADSELRLDMAQLRQTINADIAAGLQPMLISLSAGTTDTGTIDPLDAGAAVADETGAWLHVDAAYGGFFVLTDRGADRLRGIERADSITLDAHKSLFLPFGVGGLLVRDESALLGALDGRGAYMQDVPAHGTVPNYFAMSPELTRPARGLETWLALQLHGIAPFRDALDRMLDLAAWATAELRTIDGIRVIAEPELSIVAFHSESGDAATQHIAKHMIDSGDVHVSSTTVDGNFMIRLAFLSQRTEHDVAVRAVELVREALQQ